MCLGFSSDVFYSFQNHVSVYPPLTLVTTYPAHQVLLDLIALLMLVTFRNYVSSFRIFPQFPVTSFSA
jgi:hypothetical protein